MEIDKGVRLEMENYGLSKYIFSMNIPMTANTKVYNECILSAAMYQ